MNKPFRHYLNHDPAPSGGSSSDSQVLDVSSEPAAAPASPSAPTNQPPAPTSIVELADLSSFKDFGDETPKDLKEATAVATEKKAPGIKVEVDNELVLDLDPLPTNDSLAVAPEEETSWKVLAKEIDLPEIAEDNFDAFKQAFSSKLEQERVAAQKNAIENKTQNWTPEQKELFDFLSVEGNTIESFLNPLSVYDKYLALDDRDLLIEDYKLKGYEDEKITDLIDELEIDNKLNNRAYELRKALESGKESKKYQLVNEARLKIEQKNNRIIEQEAREFESFKSSLHATKDFMGIPITERSYPTIENKFKDGYYRTRLVEDSKLAADVALFIEFKDKARSLLGNDLKDEGRMQILKTVHNVGLPSSGAGRINGESDDLQGFDVWERKLAEEKAKAKGR